MAEFKSVLKSPTCPMCRSKSVIKMPYLSNTQYLQCKNCDVEWTQCIIVNEKTGEKTEGCFFPGRKVKCSAGG
jgi:formate dehydrogenase maturation protein FdhE